MKHLKVAPWRKTFGRAWSLFWLNVFVYLFVCFLCNSNKTKLRGWTVSGLGYNVIMFCYNVLAHWKKYHQEWKERLIKLWWQQWWCSDGVCLTDRNTQRCREQRWRCWTCLYQWPGWTQDTACWIFKDKAREENWTCPEEPQSIYQ